MSQIHGKQIKGSTVKFNKLNTANQTLTIPSGSKIQHTDLPTNGLDLTNKDYVDSIASGLVVKDSVKLATTADIGVTYDNGTSGVGATLTGTTTLTIDTKSITVGDRILVKNQTDAVENGIYDVTTGGASWELTRATDFDGSSTGDVKGGEFVFTIDGDVNDDTGWVVSSPSGSSATIGTTEILWVQFSSAGIISPGEGLVKTGNVLDIVNGDGTLSLASNDVSVNIDDNTIGNGINGLEVKDIGIGSSKLKTSVAGVGLSGGAGSALGVNVNNGLSINSDNVELGGSVTKATTLDVTSNSLNIYGGGTDGLSIAPTSTQIGSDGSYVKFTHLTDNLDINISGTAIITDARTTKKGVEYAADYSINFTNRSLVDKQYVDDEISSNSGHVSEIVAGAGINGSGTSTIQLDLELTTNGGLKFSTLDDTGTLELDYSEIGTTLAGDGLAKNVTTLDVNTGDGLTIASDAVEVVLIANSGLSFTTGAVDLNLGTGLAISGANVMTDASISNITTALSTVGVASGVSIQDALTALDSRVGEIKTLDLTPVASANFTSGTNAVKSTTIPSESNGETWVYLNGVEQLVGGTTGSVWFWGSNSTTARSNKSPQTGDKLFVNIGALGHSVSGSNFDGDSIDIKFDALG